MILSRSRGKRTNGAFLTRINVPGTIGEFPGPVRQNNIFLPYRKTGIFHWLSLTERIGWH